MHCAATLLLVSSWADAGEVEGSCAQTTPHQGNVVSNAIPANM